jgi:ketosteroid isomerase-like protein
VSGPGARDSPCGEQPQAQAVTDPSNLALLDQFYAAFARLDGEAMARCYAPDASFSDPVFVGLRGEQPGGMWRMLTSRAKDLSVEVVSRDADERAGTAHWVAHYAFAQTGRPVMNDVQSQFRFADGMIISHVDDFDFHRWSRQALGLPGLLFGATLVLRGSVQRKARAGLDKFLATP